MAGPLTIYECLDCGHVERKLGDRYCPQCEEEGERADMREVRVFREEDVRPLWEAAAYLLAHGEGKDYDALDVTVEAFPAPEEWKR